MNKNDKRYTKTFSMWKFMVEFYRKSLKQF